MGREGEEGDFNTLVLKLTNDAQSGVQRAQEEAGRKGTAASGN